MRRNICHRNSVVDRRAFRHSAVICLAAALTALFFIQRGATLSASPWANIPGSFATGEGTGLVLGFDEGANVWFAHAVWANSPAEQAGIPVGAQVVSIGGVALPVGAGAKEPSALTEIESRLGAAASVGSIAVGWQDSGGALHNDQIRFEPMPDLYLAATANGCVPPVQCFFCDRLPSGAICGLVPPGAGGSLVCVAVGFTCVTSGGFCIGIGTTPASASTPTSTPTSTIPTSTPTPPSPPPLASVVSRMTHGNITNPPYFDVTLPLTGTRGVECRTSALLGAGAYTLVFTFVNNVTSCGVASTSGGVSTSPSVPNGNQCTVNLTGVSNAQYVTVTLTGVVDSECNAGDVSATMGVLIGDVNANGVVTNADVSLVKAQVAAGGSVDPLGSNFRNDVNANGVVTNADVSLTKAQVAAGAQLPSPP